jgi:hypothetical protein
MQWLIQFSIKEVSLIRGDAATGCVEPAID